MGSLRSPMDAASSTGSGGTTTRTIAEWATTGCDRRAWGLQNPGPRAFPTTQHLVPHGVLACPSLFAWSPAGRSASLTIVSWRSAACTVNRQVSEAHVDSPKRGLWQNQPLRRSEVSPRPASLHFTPGEVAPPELHIFRKCLAFSHRSFGAV